MCKTKEIVTKLSRINSKMLTAKDSTYGSHLKAQTSSQFNYAQQYMHFPPS